VASRPAIRARSKVKSLIILAPYFPPSTLAGVHRARHLAKHLPAAGWKPIVLAVDERYHEERLDLSLGRLVPSGVEMAKVQAYAVSWARSLGFGDLSLRAFPHIRSKLFALLSTRPVDAVLITGSPYYTMLLAPQVRRRFGVPVVLDFQDPWVSAWGASLPPLSKGGLSDRLARSLEPIALKGASFVTSVSQVQNDEMAARYPWLDRSRMAAIPIGCDPADFDALRAETSITAEKHLAPGKFNLSFVGTFMPRSEPMVRALLSAFARWRSIHPGAAQRVRLNFIGTSNQPNAGIGPRVLPLAKAIGVLDAVHEVPERLPYLEALGVLARSDGILLIGSDEPHYTASKIYPGLMSGRPWLSLFHPASSAHRILADASGGIALAFDGVKGLEQIDDAIATGLHRLVSKPAEIGRCDPSAYANFTASSIAAQFGKVFDVLLELTPILVAAARR
jgi:hypothetical protein